MDRRPHEENMSLHFITDLIREFCVHIRPGYSSLTDRSEKLSPRNKTE